VRIADAHQPHAGAVEADHAGGGSDRPDGALRAIEGVKLSPPTRLRRVRGAIAMGGVPEALHMGRMRRYRAAVIGEQDVGPRLVQGRLLVGDGRWWRFIAAGGAFIAAPM